MTTDTLRQKWGNVFQLDLPALPVELNELKQTIFLQFSKLWPTPQEFKGVWSTITEAIGQAAQGVRKKGQQELI